jgi:hypothetical protein
MAGTIRNLLHTIGLYPMVHFKGLMASPERNVMKISTDSVEQNADRRI